MRRSPLLPRPHRQVGLLVLTVTLVVALVGSLLPVRPAASPGPDGDAAPGTVLLGRPADGAAGSDGTDGSDETDRTGGSDGTAAADELFRATTAGAAGAAAEDDAPPPWVWPTGTREVVRPWEAPASEYAAGHRGIDLATPLGTSAVAVADGTVSFAGRVAGRGVVSIDHGEGLVSTLDSVEPSVATGDTVRQGTAVGLVTVGHCPATAPCVHLGARVDGHYVDPLRFLSPAAWPVLLPESAWPG